MQALERNYLTMKKSVLLIVASGLMATALTLPAMAQNYPPEPPIRPGQGDGRRGEQHPEIQGAIRSLEQAKHQLQNGAHDFDGHRGKALEHINQALEECHAALRADRR